MIVKNRWIQKIMAIIFRMAKDLPPNTITRNGFKNQNT